MNFLLRFLLPMALAYFLFTYLSGSQNRDPAGMLLTAAVIALFDGFFKPATVMKRMPITLYTLALLLTVINLLLIKLCDLYIPGFEIGGWLGPLAVAFAVAVLSLLIDRIVKGD